MGTAPKRPKRKPTGDGLTMRIVYDGETFHVPADPNKIPAGVRRELWVQSDGITFGALIDAMASGQTDSFFLIAFLFLAKRAAGERVKYQALERTFDEALLTDVSVIDLSEDAEAPEA